MNDEMQLLSDLKQLFETAVRSGKSEDKPEGTRHIVISDTLSNIFSKRIRDVLEKRNKKWTMRIKRLFEWIIKFRF